MGALLLLHRWVRVTHQLRITGVDRCKCAGDLSTEQGFFMHAPTRALINSGECVDGCANDEGGGCLVGMRFVCDLVLCRRLNSFVGELVYIHTHMRACMHAHTYVRISIISATGASTCKTLSCVAPVATAQMKRSNISATAAGNGDSNPCQYPHKNTRAHTPHPHKFHA